jgi:hypothetical protein
MTDDLTILSTAANGLLYPSEQDAPWTAFRWKGVRWPDARAAVLADCGYDPGDAQPPVKTESVADFFDRLAGFSPDHDRLRAAIEQVLIDPLVLHVGRVDVAVYVIGRTRDGRWAGAWTTAVET